MTYRTFFKSVYELRPIEEDYRKLEGKRVGKVYEYTAASDSIIVHIGSTYLHVAVGNKVNADVLKNLMYVALTHKKPVKLEFCESLNNLQVVDQVILKINEYLGFKDILI
jgi:hypothetical protein